MKTGRRRIWRMAWILLATAGIFWRAGQADAKTPAFATEAGQADAKTPTVAPEIGWQEAVPEVTTGLRWQEETPDVTPETTSSPAPAATPFPLNYVQESDGTVTITGCSEEARVITIPEQIAGKTVVRIAPRAFENNQTLSGVTIQGTVREIGEFAFAGDTALLSIHVSQKLDSIGNGAFYGCAGLFDVVFAKGVLTIGDYAFRDCAKLVDFDLTRTKRLGRNVFLGCPSELLLVVRRGSVPEKYAREQKHSYVYPDRTVRKGTRFTRGGLRYLVTSSGKKGCEVKFLGLSSNSVSKLVIPDTVSLYRVSYKVTAVDEYACFGNKKLGKVIVGKYVRKIGAHAFSYCPRLKKIIYRGKHR